MKRKYQTLSLVLTFLSLGLWSAWAEALSFSAHGYYRVFLDWAYDLDTQTPSDIQQGARRGNDRFGNIVFAEHRFRIEPILKVNDNISFQAQFDLLDNVIFGSHDIQQLTVYSPVTGTLPLPGGAAL